MYVGASEHIVMIVGDDALSISALQHLCFKLPKVTLYHISRECTVDGDCTRCIGTSTRRAGKICSLYPQIVLFTAVSENKFGSRGKVSKVS
jgi:hypothetical protein